ncbi:hypothetical protein ACJRO7_031965 [Eucalyptus globulus]|uniref:Uncharacterized protein n=1 Tax=Eucalyptus globulus TaxID=34317 RepID=A0ABD3JJP0_EUCGL
MWYKTLHEDNQEMWDILCGESNEAIEIKSDEQAKEMVRLQSKRGFIELTVLLRSDRFEHEEYDDDTISRLREVWTMKTDMCSSEDGAEWDVSIPNEGSDSATEGESQTDGTSSIDDVQSQLGNAKSFEATENRRQIGDDKVGHYGAVDGGKTASTENRKEKRDETVEPVHLIYQQCEGIEHHEMPCKATTEVEDEIDIASVKTDRIAETDQVPSRRGRGSGTRCASNPPGRNPAMRGRARGTASSPRNSKATMSHGDAAFSSGKSKASDSGRGRGSSSWSSTVSSTGRGRGRGSTSGEGATSSSGRGRGSSPRNDTTKTGSSLRLGTDKGSSSALSRRHQGHDKKNKVMNHISPSTSQSVVSFLL